jgi:hypothetical protein
MIYDSERTLDASLDLVSPLVSPILVPPESLSHVRDVARLLPIYAVDFFGFECRLGSVAAPVDCAMNLTPLGARLLAGRTDRPLPPALGGGRWPRLREFYSQWANTALTAYADAGSTWLEFDAASGDPYPNLLFGYWPLRNPARTPEWLADRIIPLLLGFALSPRFRATFLRCFEERPEEVEDFQIGVMLSRNIPAVRLCVFDLPPSQLFTYLDAIGWRGSAQRLAAYLEALALNADFVGLHLDVGEQVYPQIGVEPNFRAGCWSRQPPKEKRWEGQFEELERHGLVVPEKKRALLAWVGHQSFGPGEKETLLLRGLSHLKVVLRADGEALAKAYFGIAHRTLGASHNVTAA